MDVILHLGAHRTGTTTLQQLLQRNQAALSEAGLQSWTPDRTRAGLLAGLVQRPQDLTPQIEARARRSTGIIGIEIERLAKSGCRQLLISEENLIGAVRNNLRESRLYPKADVRLARLGPALAQHVTTIGLSIRSFDAYWTSSIAFGVAQGHAMPGQPKLQQLVEQPRRWRHLVQEIATAFPRAKILVWPFERYVSQPEAQLASMTNGLQLSYPLSGSRDWHNSSPRLDKLRRILTIRGEAHAASRLPEGNGRWTPFDTDQREALRRQYLEDLAWFSSKANSFARFVDGDTAPADPSTDLAYEPREKQYEVSGFAADLQPWVPPEGGQESGKQNIMV